MPHFTLWDVQWPETRVGTSSVSGTCELRDLISGKRYSQMLNLQPSLHSICNFSSNEFAMIRQFQFARKKKKKWARISRKILYYAGDFHYSEKPCSPLSEVFRDWMCQHGKPIMRDEITRVVSWRSSISFSEKKFSSVSEILLQCSYLAAWLVLMLWEWC